MESRTCTSSSRPRSVLRRLGEKGVAVSDLEVTDDQLAIALIRVMSSLVGVATVDWFASGPTPTRREDPLAELPLDDGGLRKLLRRSKRVWREQPCA
jgi:hypothetical protein